MGSERDASSQGQQYRPECAEAPYAVEAAMRVLCIPYDTTLLWAEYLVKVTLFDQSLPGRWSESDRVWLVEVGEPLKQSIAHARAMHMRVRIAIAFATRRLVSTVVESEKVEPLLKKTVPELLAMLGGRSPLEEVERAQVASEQVCSRSRLSPG